MNSAEQCVAISSNLSCGTEAVEEDLLAAARSGSHAAFAELQKTHSVRVYKRILSITRNREDAEDALQDTFLRAYLALPSFEGKSQFSTWLMRIGINSALMILRRRRCRPETSFEQPQDFESDGAYLDVRDKAFDPEQLYDQQQRCEEICRALQRLDPKLRGVMHIRLSEEQPMQKIAQDLGVSVAAVKARLYRARQRLLRSPVLGTRREAISSGRGSGRACSSSREHWQRNADSDGADSISMNNIASCM